MEGSADFFRVFQDGFGLSTEWCNMPLLRLAMISLSPPLVSTAEVVIFTEALTVVGPVQSGGMGTSSLHQPVERSTSPPSIHLYIHPHTSIPPSLPSLPHSSHAQILPHLLARVPVSSTVTLTWPGGSYLFRPSPPPLASGICSGQVAA